MRPRLILVTLAAVAVVTGCSGGDGSGPGAAEPATAPATSTPAAGAVRAVGAQPEGIVYAPVLRRVVVAVRHPDRLLILNAGTLAAERAVPLPGSVRHLQLGRDSGPVLVPVESANRILTVALPGGDITSSVRVRKQPHDAAETRNGDVVVGNEFGKSISIVHDGKVVSSIADLTQPGGVIADGDTVGVVDVGAFTLSTYDVRNHKRTGRVDAGAGPTHGVLVSGNRMVVADTRGNRALVFSAKPLKQVASLRLPGTPYGMAVDRASDLVWVTLTARNQVVGLDVHGTTPRVVARYATVRQPNTVAVAPGSHQLWITGTEAGVVQLITR